MNSIDNNKLVHQELMPLLDVKSYPEAMRGEHLKNLASVNKTQM